MRKTLATAAVIVCFSAHASANNTFKLKDNSIETQLCVIEAEQGVSAASRWARTFSPKVDNLVTTVKCNGETLFAFSKRFSGLRTSYESRNDETRPREVSLIARDEAIASQLCIDAVTIGEKEARHKYGLKNEPIICNDRPLKHFIAFYESKLISEGSN